MFTIPDENLKPRHKIVLRYDLMGKTNAQIASMTGYAKNTVAQIKTQEDYKNVKDTMKRELDQEFIEKAAEKMTDDPVRAQLEEAKTKAMELNIKMMQNAESENVRQKAIFDILDRAGYQPTKKIKQDTNVNIDEDLAEGISEALTDLRALGDKDETE